MTEHTKLVERLRAYPSGPGVSFMSDAIDLLSEAAQALTQLEARALKAEGERDEWKERALDRGVVGANWMDRAQSAEASLALAVEALEQIERGVGRVTDLAFGIPAPNAVSPQLVMVAQAIQHKARSVLQSLRGETT